MHLDASLLLFSSDELVSQLQAEFWPTSSHSIDAIKTLNASIKTEEMGINGAARQTQISLLFVSLFRVTLPHPSRRLRDVTGVDSLSITCLSRLAKLNTAATVRQFMASSARC